jgi:hypothetical protein
MNERSKNFTHKDCETHFYPKGSLSTTELDENIEGLKLFEFGALLSICFFMVVLSVVSLLFEIVTSKFFRDKLISSNPEKDKSSKMYTFSYKSAKCADLQKFMKLLTYLHKDILNDDDLKVLYSFIESTKILGDNLYEIFISIGFDLYNPDKLDRIIKQFNVFTDHLDSISVK